MTTDRIALILSGSCTPACDLLEAVRSGEVSRQEATAAYKRTRPTAVCLESAAQSELEQMRRLDV